MSWHVLSELSTYRLCLGFRKIFHALQFYSLKSCGIWQQWQNRFSMYLRMLFLKYAVRLNVIQDKMVRDKILTSYVMHMMCFPSFIGQWSSHSATYHIKHEGYHFTPLGKHRGDSRAVFILCIANIPAINIQFWRRVKCTQCLPREFWDQVPKTTFRGGLDNSWPQYFCSENVNVVLDHI